MTNKECIEALKQLLLNGSDERLKTDYKAIEQAIEALSLIDGLRLMKVEECAGHSIEYAMGWRACVKWLEAGGDKQYFSTDEVPRDLTEEEIVKVKEVANKEAENDYKNV